MPRIRLLFDSPAVELRRWAGIQIVSRREMHRRCRALFIGLSVTLGCKPRGVEAFWHAAGRYNLVLYGAADSTTLVLAVDSIARDTVFGSANGASRPFPVALHAVGGDQFIGTRDRERWAIRLNPQVTDTGFLLSGELSNGRLRGGWTPLRTSPARGTFTVAPAT
jgi:hypothetical protein